MENEEEPSVLTLLTDFDTENHGLDVMRLALNYQVIFKYYTISSNVRCLIDVTLEDFITLTISDFSPHNDLQLGRSKKN